MFMCFSLPSNSSIGRTRFDDQILSFGYRGFCMRAVLCAVSRSCVFFIMCYFPVFCGVLCVVRRVSELSSCSSVFTFYVCCERIAFYVFFCLCCLCFLFPLLLRGLWPIHSSWSAGCVCMLILDVTVYVEPGFLTVIRFFYPSLLSITTPVWRGSCRVKFFNAHGPRSSISLLRHCHCIKVIPWLLYTHSPLDPRYRRELCTLGFEQLFYLIFFPLFAVMSFDRTDLSAWRSKRFLVGFLFTNYCLFNFYVSVFWG